ncbi:MAG TPA: hypothetical protein VML55_20870 [Planctomycetaceae bacterium]|nr:hypothetical protein [Planctomycetaceae bacterium]
MSGLTTGKRTPVSRPLVGIITLALLGTWAGVWILHAAGALDADQQPLKMWWAGCGRVGLVMFALWLALPGGGRPAAWANLSKPMLAVFLLIAVVVAVRPVRLAIFLPLLVLLAGASLLLRPRLKRRPDSRAV